jgi:hypothetical protein
MTFICSDDMKEKLLFDRWLNIVNPTDNYNFNYKDDYKADIQVRQYGVEKFISYQVNLLKAFPIGVSDLQLDWSSDGYHKVTVTFSYKEWIYVQPPSPPTRSVEVFSNGSRTIVNVPL